MEFNLIYSTDAVANSVSGCVLASSRTLEPEEWDSIKQKFGEQCQNLDLKPDNPFYREPKVDRLDIDYRLDGYYFYREDYSADGCHFTVYVDAGDVGDVEVEEIKRKFKRDRDVTGFTFIKVHFVEDFNLDGLEDRFGYPWSEYMLKVLRLNLIPPTAEVSLRNPPREGVPTPLTRTKYLASVRAYKNQQLTEPAVGDYIEFADGVTRLISHCWVFDGDPPEEWYYQTSTHGSIYLCPSGEGSFSGGLDGGPKRPSLTLSENRKLQQFWMFKDDHHTAHNGVSVLFDVKVWKCTEKAPRTSTIK